MGFMTDMQKRLVSENHELIYEFLEKYGLSEEEYYGVAAIGLCNASMSYKKYDEGFCKYAEDCMLKAVKRELADRQGKDCIPADAVSYFIDVCDGYTERYSGGCIEESALLRIMISEILQELCDNERKVAKLIFRGFTQKEIIQILKVPSHRVVEVRRKVRHYLL